MRARGGIVGIVVNPSASRDVRRLTSLARTVDTHERVNAVARILGGLAGAGVADVRFMPEPSHVVERAMDAMSAVDPSVRAMGSLACRPVGIPGGDRARDAADTSAAAGRMAEEGVACVVTLGGDGTNRAVASGWLDVTLVPLPGGTNNAFALPVDPTAAGLAAGVFALDPSGYANHVRAAAHLEILVDGEPAGIALVDVAVVRGGWVGAHAIWDPDLLVEAVIARSDPLHPGLAGLAGMLHPLNGPAPRALHVRFGRPGARLLAPLGPGRLEAVAIREWEVLEDGRSAILSSGRVTVAFDGERELVPGPHAELAVRLVRGSPRVLDVEGLLREAAAKGRFLTRPGPGRV